MFNLIVRSFDWHTGRGVIPVDRLFEYTDEHIAERLRRDGNPLLDQLAKLPCLFMEEGRGDEIAHIGSVYRPRILGDTLSFEFTLDREVPPLCNSMIFANRHAMAMGSEFEFSRNHWAVKDVDLYQFLLRNVRPRRQRPIVFSIAEHEGIEPTLASAMMPFDPEFNPVYECVQGAAAIVGLQCRRADNIWEDVAVIQDVVGLIDRSRVVVCDCTGKNANVFYEAGIAHTLGREVILIAQKTDDMPFDLRHLRHLRYENSPKGLSLLAEGLTARMRAILGK